MINIIPELEEVVNSKIKTEFFETTQHLEVFYYSHFDFKLNNKNRKALKETLPKIKEIAEKNEFFFIYKIWKRLRGKRAVFKMCFKNKNNVLAEPPKTIYHISPSRNRKKILKEGLIPQLFEKSRWKKDLNYYYQPAVFCSEKPTDFNFLFDEDDRKHDIWEINLNNVENKWFYDSNMGEKKYSFMTFERIKPEALKLLNK
jgi:hypothetical protein